MTLGTGAGTPRCWVFSGPEGTSPTGSTWPLIAAMASTDVRMADPIAVPRPVLSASSDVSSDSESVVGGTMRAADPEKATSPSRASAGWARTNARTASRAAVSRLGTTSVAHIERETSRARMTAVRCAGTSTEACGRATARPNRPTPSTRRATGRWGRHRDREGSAARTSARSGWRTAYRRRRRNDQRYAASSPGASNNAGNARGQANDTQITLPVRMIEVAAAATSTSRAAAANSAEISVCTGVLVTARSIDP